MELHLRFSLFGLKVADINIIVTMDDTPSLGVQTVVDRGVAKLSRRWFRHMVQ